MDSDNRNSNAPEPGAPSAGEQSGFQIEMAGPSRKRSWILAGVVVAAAVFLIGSVILSSGVMDAWLPWTQEYAQRSVPPAPDGGEPIALLEFSQSQDEETITVTGRVRNRTEDPIENLIATLTLITSLALPVVEDVAVIPESLEAGSEGTFEWRKPLTGAAGGLKLKFKLSNGAVIQHRDSRHEQTEEAPAE